MRAQHHRLARSSRSGNRGDGGKRLLDRRGRPGRGGRGDRCRTVRSMVTYEGANAFFAALPVAASAAMDVKIDETRQNEGTLRLGVRGQCSAIGNGDKLTCEFHLA